MDPLPNQCRTFSIYRLVKYENSTSSTLVLYRRYPSLRLLGKLGTFGKCRRPIVSRLRRILVLYILCHHCCLVIDTSYIRCICPELVLICIWMDILVCIYCLLICIPCSLGIGSFHRLHRIGRIAHSFGILWYMVLFFFCQFYRWRRSERLSCIDPETFHFHIVHNPFRTFLNSCGICMLMFLLKVPWPRFCRCRLRILRRRFFHFQKWPILHLTHILSNPDSS